MRVYEGYMTNGSRKAAFELGASSKADAHRQMKLKYPSWRIFVVTSRLVKIKKRR